MNPNHSLSSSGKWRSRRAEKLKQNPHQKQVYSSNPIQPSHHLSNNAQQNDDIESDIAIAPFKDTRFSRFAQEQKQLISNASISQKSNTPTTNRYNKHVQNGEHEDNTEHIIQSSKAVNHAQNKWFYKDPSGQEQGPFDQSQMSQWFGDGYFPQDLPIRSDPKMPFVQLKDWFHDGLTGLSFTLTLSYLVSKVFSSNILKNT